MPYYALIDLEGERGDFVEIAIYLVTNDKIAYTYLDYARPRNHAAHRRSQLHAHGIEEHTLQSLTDQHSSTLEKKALQFLNSYTIIRVLSADETRTSDVGELAERWGYAYTPIPLAKWLLRTEKASHINAHLFRDANPPVIECACWYAKVHTTAIIAMETMDTHGRIKKPTPSRIKRAASGAHCAFYDCMELWLELREDPQWSHRLPPLPQPVESDDSLIVNIHSLLCPHQ